MIVSEHKQFESYQYSLFNRKTLSNDIKYVLRDLKGTDVDTHQLEKAFKKYETTYKILVDEYLAPDIKLNQFLANFKIILNQIRLTDVNRINWNSKIEDLLPELVGHVFALWTLLKSHNFFKISEKDYLFQPHPAQVISILRMLGIGYSQGFKQTIINIKNSFFGYDKNTSLKNNLVQIGTGEGKSVTLAVSSAVLALVGFDVYCVCYSEYLSDRDYLFFEPLFKILGIEEQISYGTFNNICNDSINVNGDIGKTLKSMILEGDLKALKIENSVKKNARPRILLIDEVDVFFGSDFYGNSYNPIISLTHPTINELLKYIWKERKSSHLYSKVRMSGEYNKCLQTFPKWQELIKEATKEVIVTLNSTSTNESLQYVVKDNKIGYKYQDEINFNINYGYKTIITYLLEHEKGNIDSMTLNSNLAILIRIGVLSYAEIPLENFNSIIGVTGTLETINILQKNIIENEYQIKNFTYTPSVYGRNNLEFDKMSPRHVMIEKEENHFQVICMEIKSKVSCSKPVPVFVVFESIKELRSFYSLKEFLPLRSQAHVLTEEANNEERINLVNSSTLCANITLFTRSFGRGTDFIVYDEAVKHNGGVHVIQTFLSEEYAEEVQIRGRTARQGDPGTFQLILSLSSLEKYFVTENDLLLMPLVDRYQYIDKKRREYFDSKYAESIRSVSTMKAKHNTCKLFLENIFTNKIDENKIKEVLLKENFCSRPIEKYQKTLILLDATGSMTQLLDKTKNTIETMFERVTHVLDKNNINKSFQLKIAVYRNYNSPEDKILEESTWEFKPQNLVHFLKAIKVEGGDGNEAIEIGLFQANQETDLSQVILIGDAPANTKEEVTSKRAKSYNNVWENSLRYNKPTHYKKEMNLLKENGIKVHSFYVAERAKDNFEEISSFTGGNCKCLDINSSKGSEDLMNLVNVEILNNIGGNDLVHSYNQIYHLQD